MQYSDIAFLKKASWSRRLGYLLKAGILCAITIFIFFKLKEHPVKVSDLTAALTAVMQQESLGLLLLLPFLSFINWLLEAFKWQLLVSKIEKISLVSGLRGVLTGLSLGFITPHALGDYAGRIWQLQGKKRLESIGAVMLGRASQFFATFVFGLFGVIYFLYEATHATNFYWMVFGGMFFSLLIGLLLFVYGRKAFLSLLSIKVLRKYKKYFEVIVVYSSGEVLKLIALAFIRYAIFAFQFLILLYLFKVSDDNVLLISGVTWTFLAKSTIPAFNFLSDLGVREFSALYFFSYYHVEVSLVLLASFALWCINILLPSLAGLAGIVTMSIFRKK